MKKNPKIAISIVFLTVAITASFFLGKYYSSEKHELPPHQFTDGVVIASFNKESGVLSFSGNGAVVGTSKWLEDFRDERIFVRAIVFEDGITSIGNAEFSGISNAYANLEKITFRGDINAIGACAFSSNRNLTTVEFGGKCRVIDELAFFECSSLEDINVPDECEVSYAAFHQTPIDESETIETTTSPSSAKEDDETPSLQTSVIEP